MKLLNTRSFIFFSLAALSGIVLLHTSQNVQHAESRVTELEKSIQMEQERIRMLRAEWAHLNRPERLEKLAQEFLDLAPPPTKEMPQHLMADYPEYPPEIEEAPAAVIPREIELQPVSAVPKKAKTIPMKAKEEPVKKPVTQEVKRDFSSVLESLKEGAP